MTKIIDLLIALADYLEVLYKQLSLAEHMSLSYVPMSLGVFLTIRQNLLKVTTFQDKSSCSATYTYSKICTRSLLFES